MATLCCQVAVIIKIKVKAIVRPIGISRKATTGGRVEEYGMFLNECECVSGPGGHGTCSVSASDVEDIAERLKNLRSGNQGSAGRSHDFLNTGTRDAEAGETIHKAVNDTAWWLK